MVVFHVVKWKSEHFFSLPNLILTLKNQTNSKLKILKSFGTEDGMRNLRGKKRKGRGERKKYWMGALCMLHS